MKCIKCPKCNCNKVTLVEKIEYDKNYRQKVLQNIGAGISGIVGVCLLPIPGFHYFGLAGLAGAGLLGKCKPSANMVYIYKYTCPNCGHKWETKE